MELPCLVSFDSLLFSSSSPILTPIDYPVLGEHIDKHLLPRIHGYLSTLPTIGTFTLSQDSVIKMDSFIFDYEHTLEVTMTNSQIKSSECFSLLHPLTPDFPSQVGGMGVNFFISCNINLDFHLAGSIYKLHCSCVYKKKNCPPTPKTTTVKSC